MGIRFVLRSKSYGSMSTVSSKCECFNQANILIKNPINDKGETRESMVIDYA